MMLWFEMIETGETGSFFVGAIYEGKAFFIALIWYNDGIRDTLDSEFIN